MDILDKLKVRITYVRIKAFQILKWMFCKKVYVFGDSHTEVFDYINKTILFHKYYYKITWVGGATAQGLRNPNSKTESVLLFKKKINSIDDKKAILFFQLGEVDVGFVIWYRALKYGEAIIKQLHNSITAYFEFIDWVLKEGFVNINIISAPLPTIADNQDFGKVANERKQIKATQIERTELTLLYNQSLKSGIQKRKLQFIDCDENLIDRSTKIIKNRFLNNDRTNHHLNNKEYAKLLVNKIKYEHS